MTTKSVNDVIQWAQCVLTTLNTGDVMSESLLHKKLREVMIAYREYRDKPDPVKEVNQAAMNVLAGAAEFVETLALAKDANSSDDPLKKAALVLAVQSREKFKMSVTLLNDAHVAAFGTAFNQRCAWTFEMPPVTGDNQ